MHLDLSKLGQGELPWGAPGILFPGAHRFWGSWVLTGSLWVRGELDWGAWGRKCL